MSYSPTHIYLKTYTLCIKLSSPYRFVAIFGNILLKRCIFRGFHAYFYASYLSRILLFLLGGGHCFQCTVVCRQKSVGRLSLRPRWGAWNLPAPHTRSCAAWNMSVASPPALAEMPEIYRSPLSPRRLISEGRESLPSPRYLKYAGRSDDRQSPPLVLYGHFSQNYLIRRWYFIVWKNARFYKLFL